MLSGFRRGRFASWLALTALALQLVLSFGHVHLDGTGRGDYRVTAAGLSAQASRPPPVQHSGDAGDDYCAICASIYLAANSFVPQPPQLAVPFHSQAVEHVDRAAVLGIALRRTPFQSRAPPLA